MSRPPEQIAFLGFGLIGGSIARALARPGSGPSPTGRPRLIAWTPTGNGPERALAEGVIDRTAASPADAIDGADLVVIAAPPIESIALVRRLGTDLAAHLGPECLVTDVTSTKAAIIAAAEEAGVRFVGGHPMAGRETNGYRAAADDLFVGRPWIIVSPGGDSDPSAEPVRWLARSCGARPVEMSARAHDAATAAVSHLPLVAAAALVESVVDRGGRDWDLARTLAASGWANATRLALGDPRMGAGIVATNAEEIAANVRALRDVLDGWLAAIERDGGPDVDEIERRLATVRASLQPEPEPPT
ncbi:MAG: prephenate dehydrogenase/arogenate dehydrogenase family protein [Chloroflexi bacterium]|nr:prephenate dehydrogenase/arogenate dehydrogenase family protein [Chloroflexota bacterium]